MPVPQSVVVVRLEYSRTTTTTDCGTGIAANCEFKIFLRKMYVKLTCDLKSLFGCFNLESTFSLNLSVAVPGLQVAILARSSRAISQTVRIDCHSLVFPSQFCLANCL